MHRQTANRERRIQRAEPVDIIHHTQQDWRTQRRVCCQALEVVCYADTGRCAGVEAREPAVLEGDVVVETHEFHEHVCD